MTITTFLASLSAVDWLHVAAAVIAISSALANIVPPDSKVGRALHFLALNGPKIVKAINDSKSVIGQPVTVPMPAVVTTPSDGPKGAA